MTNVLWHSAVVDNEQVEQLMNQFQVPRRVARWLCLRRVPESEVAAWLEPHKAEWSSPNQFTDMEAGVTVLLEAMASKDKICIVGDYDVDGVTASAIVASTLDALGANWTCVIPHRVDDGYGLSVPLVERARDLGSRVIVTVDNGIRAQEALQRAFDLGIRVILTDHHAPGETLPDTPDAIVHWAKSTDATSAVLSGAGVAWKFADALLRALPENSLAETELQSLRNWHIGLAALGAIADVMPMRGENRKLVQAGLKVLGECERPGWQALCEVSKVNPKELTDTVVAWSITPRMNAAGRMGNAEIAFRLLMATDLTTAQEYAEQVEQWNRERKRDTERAFEEAVEEFEQYENREDVPIVVVAGPWNLGVVGIVAAKLVGRYGRPAVVLADDGGEVIRGSGRAPDGFPLHDTLQQCQEWMVHFGGHEVAVGCGVRRTDFNDFRRAVEVCTQQAPSAPRTDGLVADDYLPLTEVNIQTLQWVQRFAPFGSQNPALSFYIGPVEINKVTPMGNGKHVRLKVKEGNSSLDMVWFQAPPEIHEWTAGSLISAVCHLEENTWQGVMKPQLRILSAHRLQKPLLREDFGAVYRVLQARRRLSVEEASLVVSKHRHTEAQVIFDTFVELGFAQLQDSAYYVNEQVVSRDLRDSTSYQAHLWQSTCARY